MLDALDQRLQQTIVARQAGAEQESPEHCMQAEPFCRRRHCAGTNQQQAEHGAAGPAIRGVACEQPREQRPQHEETGECNRGETAQRTREPGPAAVWIDQRDNQREHDPGKHVGDRRRSESELAECAARHAAFLEDARHDRKCGDRHRRGHEQREWPETDTGRREARVQVRRDRKSKCHGQQYTENADPARRGEPFSHAVGRAQFGADDEHEQYEADLAQALERGKLAVWEQPCVHARSQSAEDDRPEHEAGDHFADHRRLTESAQQKRQQSRHAENDDQLHKQMRNRSHARSVFCRRIVDQRRRSADAAVAA